MIKNSIIQTIQEIRTGGLIDELSTDLEQLIDAVKKTKKAGTLIMKLTVAPLGKGDGCAVTVEDDVSVKKPRIRPMSIFYALDDNRLSKRDPRQKEFDLTVVDGEKKEPVKVNVEAQPSVKVG
jgi:hypothetical protein